MKLYILTSSEVFDAYNLNNTIDTLELSANFNKCDSLKSEWKVLEADMIEHVRHGELAFCFSVSDRGLIISESAKEKLSDVFTEENVEFLETYYQDEKLYLIHAIQVEDFNIDWDFTTTGQTFIFQNDDLNTYKIEDKYFFRAHLIKYPVNSTWIFTEKFINKLKELGLKGVDFKEIWDTEKK